MFVPIFSKSSGLYFAVMMRYDGHDALNEQFLLKLCTTYPTFCSLAIDLWVNDVLIYQWCFAQIFKIFTHQCHSLYSPRFSVANEMAEDLNLDDPWQLHKVENGLFHRPNIHPAYSINDKQNYVQTRRNFVVLILYPCTCAHCCVHKTKLKLQNVNSFKDQISCVPHKTKLNLQNVNSFKDQISHWNQAQFLSPMSIFSNYNCHDWHKKLCLPYFTMTFGILQSRNIFYSNHTVAHTVFCKAK